jgi:perosamine synthetase
MSNYKINQLVPFVGDEELVNLTNVINNKWLTEGPYSVEFLEQIKDFTGAKYAVLTNNGTLALFLGLLALGIEKDDEIIVPDFTFIASATSIVFSGAKPVFVDVNPDDYHIDISKIEALITDRTKAIMPVHIYGQCADMDPIMAIAKKYNLQVIEDAAQGYGVFYNKQHTGTLGDLGTISFFADKTITTGEGAVILTNNEEIFQKLQYLRNQGRAHSGTFIHPALGMNFRLTDLQCAVGVAQLKKFSEIERMKVRNYNYYKKYLHDVDEITFVKELDYCNFVPFRVSLTVQNQKELIKYLESNGIQTRGYFYPLHKQPCFSHLNNDDSDFPVSNQLNIEGLALPVYPTLEPEEILHVCDCIKTFYSNV